MGDFFFITLNKLKSTVANYSKCMRSHCMHCVVSNYSKCTRPVSPSIITANVGDLTLGTRGNTRSNRNIHIKTNCEAWGRRPIASNLWPQTVAISLPCWLVTCTKISLFVKPVFQHSVSDRDKRVVKNCLHVFHVVRKLKVQLSDPNRSVFRTLHFFFKFYTIKLSMQRTRTYEVFVKSTSGKNKDFRVDSSKSA